MMRYLKVWALVLLALVMAACGGGGNPGSSSGGGTTPPVVSTVASIELLASAASLDSADSTKGVTITAFAKNTSNVGVAAQSVAFAATSGALTGVSTVSDSNGKATAVLTTGADHSNRNITVTVTIGTVVKTIVIPVTGTTITITGSASMLVAASSSFTVALKDSGGTAIPNTTLTITSSLGNAISVAASPLTTNSAGVGSFSYTANNAGTDTLTVAGAGVSATYSVIISSTNFAFVTPLDGADINVGATGQVVSVRLLPAVAGVTINFSSTRGEVSPPSAVTDASGLATTTAKSTTAGAANITAVAATTGSPQTRRAVNFVATEPFLIVLQTNVSAIAPNTAGSTANQVTLTATVKDRNNNAVKGSIVNFSLVDTSGGTIANGTGVTNANGVVVDAYIPGATSTAANGVVLTATTAGTPPVALISDDATVTVNAQALFITIGVGNEITNLDTSTYSKPFSVYVNDANGSAVANQQVILSAYPVAYAKGVLVFDTAAGVWVMNSFVSCDNEDVDRSGIYSVGKDTNTDGALTPGSPGLIPTSSVTTSTSGSATFNLNYGEQFAPWVVFEIKARATVAGTESSKIFYYAAKGSADDFSSSTVAPAGRVSPFGTVLSCISPN
nr:Ig-like domain-containing protein [uncultured Albidiferax sp.]